MKEAMCVDWFLQCASEAENNGKLAGSYYNCAMAVVNSLLAGKDREAAKELLYELKPKLIASSRRFRYEE